MTYFQLNQHLPGACRFYRDYGRLTFAQLSRLLAAPAPHRTPSAVLRSALRRRAAAAGADPATAGRAGEAVSAQTASHHGFDCHPETVQGTLIFGLNSIISPDPVPPPVLVLASGHVPLYNSLGVGGLLFGRRGDGRRSRLNLFPRSRDGQAAAAAPPLTRPELEKAFRRLDEMVSGDIGPFPDDNRRPNRSSAELGPIRGLGLLPLEIKAGRRLFEEFFFSDDFPGGPDFLSQAAWINQSLWAARFAGPRPFPRLVFLELEAVAGDCLQADLAAPDSPAYRLLFEPRLRAEILSRLAGSRACWSAGRLEAAPDRKVGGDKPPEERGTVFFWRLDSQGRARALNLTSGARLTGPETDLPLEPEVLGAELAAGRLRPGLFLTYLTLAAHGLRVHGGVYMIDYHPPLLAEAEKLLETSLGSSAPTLLAAGPLPLGPAGALELLAASPLPPDLWPGLAAAPLAECWPFTARQWFLEEKLGQWQGGDDPDNRRPMGPSATPDPARGGDEGRS